MLGEHNALEQNVPEQNVPESIIQISGWHSIRPAIR
jgi:hypothetical protein